MEYGLYEKLIDSKIVKELKEKKNKKSRVIDTSELPKVLANTYKKKIYEKLSSLENKDQQLEFIKKLNSTVGLDEFYIEDKKLKELLSYHKDEDVYKILNKHRPRTSISSSTLLPGSSGPTLESELSREIRTSDRVDFLISFIKFSGLRLIYDDLVEFTKENKLRVITTSYMGASDYKAILKLSQLPNTEVKISYDTRRTRLHAKAYYFERNTGFSTAYIGSSNLSNPALSNGLEWNLKVSEYTSKDVVASFKKTFESYWNDDEFKTFDPLDKDNKKELKKSLDKKEKEDESSYVFFDLKPYSHQKEILENLRLEREEYGSYKNLIVAATGERVIIVMGEVCVIKSRVSGTLTKYNSCIA